MGKERDKKKENMGKDENKNTVKTQQRSCLDPKSFWILTL
jgi:hypothetical protein